MVSKGKIRIPWIDAVKLFAMLFVIFGHSSSLLSPSIIGFHEINMAVVIFNMPLFVIMTGYMGYKGLTHITDIKNLESYILKNSERIALPALSFSFLECIPTTLVHKNFLVFLVCIGALCFIGMWYVGRFKGIISGNLHNFFLIFILITAVLGFSKFWFLNMLVIILVISGILIYLLNGSSGDMRFFAFCGVTYLLLCLVDWQWVSEMVIFYLFGLAISRFNILNRFLLSLGKFVSFKLMLIIIICLAVQVIADPIDFYSKSLMNLLLDHNFYVYPLRVFLGSLIAISIILLFKKYYVNKGSMSIWGSATLGIYMIHAPFAEFFRSHTIITIANWYYWIAPLITTAVLLFFSICIIVVIRRWKLTSIIFLGEKY